MTDETSLLNKAQRFDLDALAQIYDLYSPGLYRYALRLLGDPHQAEDCVADTFSRFLQALRGGGGPQSHLQAYLYRIAHNWITDSYRRQPPPPLELNEQHPDLKENPAGQATQRLEQANLRAALVRLTPDQRQVVILKFLEGWDNEKIAESVNKPVTAIKALQHRALAALRRMLVENDNL